MKYIELVKGQFTAEHEARAKQEEPYVAYSEEAGGVMYTFIPEPVPNNELWYTSTNGTIINFPSRAFDVSIVSNEYNDGKGVLTFDGPITSIDYEGLSSNSLLTSVTLPNSVTRLASRAFWYCTSLTSVTIPNSVTSIGEEAFAYCSSLTSITIPKSVTSIAKSAFNSCKYLTSVTISEGVTSIGNYAFSSCIRLTSITIPNSVTSIGTEAFSWCSKLASVTFEGTMEEWNMVNKKSGWKANTSVTYVQCTDGQVAL